MIEVFNPGPSPSWTLAEPRLTSCQARPMAGSNPVLAACSQGWDGSTRLGKRSGGEAAGPDADLRRAATGGQRLSGVGDNVPESRLGLCGASRNLWRTGFRRPRVAPGSAATMLTMVEG